jgi:hypothetical protein
MAISQVKNSVGTKKPSSIFVALFEIYGARES